MQIYPDFLTAIMLALRARLLSTVFWFAVALIIVVWMASQFSGRQPATVALDVGLSFIRIVLPVLMILLVQELISREFDRRYYLSSLTYPRPRHWLLLGRFTAILSILLLALAIMGSILAVEAWIISKGYQQATSISLGSHYLITLTFIAVDFVTLTSMATFLSITATTPSFVLIGTIGFMLVSRSYSSILALLRSESYVVTNPELYHRSLGILGYILPDLGSLDVRMIALYDNMAFLPPDWPSLLLSTSTYALALITLALWVLHRKHFN